MLTRTAIYEGTVRDGQDDAFFRRVRDELEPFWRRFPGVTAVRVQRLVSKDADARPIAKGRLGKPVEFGAKAQVCDNADGIVLDHDVQPGNPPNAPRLKPAVERVKKRTGRTPRTVAADRGYGERQRDHRGDDARRGDRRRAFLAAESPEPAH